MTKRFLTPAEASEYLTLKVKTVYSLAARGKLPVVRFGRQLRIDLTRLDEWVDREILSNGKQCSAGAVSAARPLVAPGPPDTHRGQRGRGG